VTRLLNTLSRVENTYVVDALSAAVPQQPPARQIDESDDLSALVREIFGVEVFDRPALEEVARRAASGVTPEALQRVSSQLEIQRDEIEDLRLQNEILQERLEEEEFDHAITGVERTTLADEARWLRKQLQKSKDYASAFGMPPVDEITRYPESYVELVDRLPELEPDGIVFTGDAKTSRDLDTVDSLGKTTRNAWEALLVLRDYVRARRAGHFDAGFDDYLAVTPDGYRSMSRGKHAAKEAAQTVGRYGGERTFPVPAEVDPAGKVLMRAHFRLGSIGMVSPRMYYLDQFVKTGRIYVGYLGPHLTNQHTN
jgi:hypothetical protein